MHNSMRENYVLGARGPISMRTKRFGTDKDRDSRGRKPGYFTTFSACNPFVSAQHRDVFDLNSEQRG